MVTYLSRIIEMKQQILVDGIIIFHALKNKMIAVEILIIHLTERKLSLRNARDKIKGAELSIFYIAYFIKNLKF